MRITHLAVCMLYLIAFLLLIPLVADAAATSQGQRTASVVAPTPPDAADRGAADALLQQIWKAQPGQPTFDAIDAVVAHYKASDATTQNAIAWLCLAYLKDEKREVHKRWQCCYVLARAKCMPAVPDTILVLLNNQTEVMRAVAAEALGGLYKETGDLAVRDALLEAGRKDSSRWVLEIIARYVGPSAPAPPGPGLPNPPDDNRRRAADAVLQQIWKAQPGQPKFDAIDAVVRTYSSSDASSRTAISWLCMTYMEDRSRGSLDRWPCCYVLARAKCMESVPRLIEVLLRDETEAMRAVAAEALGGLYIDTRSTAIRDALLQAARTDQSTWVRETVARYIPSSSTN